MTTIHLPTYAEIKKMLRPLLIVLVISLLAGLVIGNWLSAAWLILGGVIGIKLLFLDEKYLQKHYRLNDQDNTLITRSPVFLLVFAVLTIYILTSTEQFIGFGVVFGVAAGILVEGWTLFHTPELFLERFTGLLAQPKPLTLPQAQLVRILIAATAFMMVMYVWWLFGQ